MFLTHPFFATYTGIFCHSCCNKAHRSGNRALHQLIPLGSYYTVDKWLRKKDELDAAISRKEEKRLQLLKSRRETQLKKWVASKLQSLWRGKLSRRKLHDQQKFARLKKRRQWKKNYDEQRIILKPSYRVLNGLGMARILPSDPIEIKKKKNMQILGQKKSHDMRTAAVAKARRLLAADTLLPGSIQIANQSNIAWTTEDLTEYIKHGDSIRIGTFVTLVDCELRPFNHMRLPIFDFWDRQNADGLPVYKILSIDELMEKVKPKKGPKKEEVVQVTVDKSEKARQKQLLDDAKYLGETSLWDVLKDEETEETYYFNKLTQKTQWEKPKCFIKQEEEKAEELRKIKAENERKRQKRANARGGFKDRKKRLQKGRAKIKQREEEEKQDRLEANAMAMER